MAAVFLFLGATSTGCASHAVQPVTLKTKDVRLPAGWARFSYGSLSVGAPATWTVRSTPWRNCSLPPQHTVTEDTDTTVRISSCGAGSTSTTVQAVAIECLRGKANGLYYGPGPTVTVNGETLHKRESMVYLQGDGWEGTVSLSDYFGPPSLGAAILTTVEPTGRPC
jgi:hypothetical protein